MSMDPANKKLSDCEQMGVVLECQTRSACLILVTLFKIHGASLNDESRRTLLAEKKSYCQY